MGGELTSLVPPAPEGTQAAPAPSAPGLGEQLGAHGSLLGWGLCISATEPLLPQKSADLHHIGYIYNVAICSLSRGRQLDIT